MIQLGGPEWAASPLDTRLAGLNTFTNYATHEHFPNTHTYTHIIGSGRGVDIQCARKDGGANTAVKLKCCSYCNIAHGYKH